MQANGATQPQDFGERADDGMEAACCARLAAAIARRLPEAGEYATAVPGLTFFRCDAGTPPASVLYEPSLSLVVQGRKRVVLGARDYEYGTGQFLVTSVDLPTVAHVPDADPAHPFLSILLRLDLKVVQEIGAEIALQGLQPGDTGMGSIIGRGTVDLLETVLRLARLSEKPRDIPIVGGLAVREIIYHLLMGPAGGRLREIAMLGTRCNRIAHVVAWLREHYAQPFGVEALAEMATMGVSTFHHHFNAMTGMSPLQYRKRIRLHEARRLLLTEPVDASTAALRVGYESVTQFNQEYRQLFGNPPIRDISSLRAGPGAPEDAVPILPRQPRRRGPDRVRSSD